MAQVEITVNELNEGMTRAESLYQTNESMTRAESLYQTKVVMS